MLQIKIKIRAISNDLFIEIFKEVFLTIVHEHRHFLNYFNLKNINLLTDSPPVFLKCSRRNQEHKPCRTQGFIGLIWNWLEK